MAERIPLRRRDGTVRAWALVSTVDYAELAGYAWHLSVGGYAVRNLPRPIRGSVLMHRQVLGLSDPKVETDHINHDRLDNRRSNLRAVCHAENAQNLPARSGSSRFRGVYWSSTSGRWVATVGLNYRRHYLGEFKVEEDAAEAAAAFRADHMPFSPEARAA